MRDDGSATARHDADGPISPAHAFQRRAWATLAGAAFISPLTLQMLTAIPDACFASEAGERHTATERCLARRHGAE